MKIQVTFLLLFISISLFSQNLTNGLKAHYKFDGNLLDASTYQNHLALDFGTVQFTSVNSTDTAVYFNNNTRLFSQNHFDNSSFTATTISLWFKSPITPTQNQVIFEGSLIGFGISIVANTGKILGYYDGSSAGSIQSNQSLTDDKWHNIILVSDGSTTSLYVDGQLNGSIQETMYTYYLTNSSPILYFGNIRAGGFPFLGNLNELRIYNRILTETERNLLSAQPVVTSLVSVEEVLINLYPNPTNNILNITSNSNAEFTYAIYDIAGRKIRSGHGSRINVAALNSGVYYIRINDIITKSFVKI